MVHVKKLVCALFHDKFLVDQQARSLFSDMARHVYVVTHISVVTSMRTCRHTQGEASGQGWAWKGENMSSYPGGGQVVRVGPGKVRTCRHTQGGGGGGEASGQGWAWKVRTCRHTQGGGGQVVRVGPGK